MFRPKFRLPMPLASAALLLALGACKVTTIVDPYYRPANARIEGAFLSPGADFRNYTKLLVTPLEIYYPEDVPPPADGDLERMRGIFRDAFRAAIGDAYPLVTEPGPDVMRVTGQIVDLKVTGAEGTYEATGRLRTLVARGHLTLLMEFRDSVTDRVLARAGETEQGTATGTETDSASWTEVETAAKRWAQLFREFLDRNLGQG